MHDSYGYKPNHRYLMNYGFSLEENVTHDGACPNEVGHKTKIDRREN